EARLRVSGSRFPIPDSRPSSRRPAQLVRQRLEARRLRLDQPELADEIAELVEDARTPGAAGEAGVRLQQFGQVLAVVVEAFRRDADDVDELVVVAVGGGAVRSEEHTS